MVVIQPDKSPNTQWIASFDIGRRNFAFVITEYPRKFPKYPSLTYAVDGTLLNPQILTPFIQSTRIIVWQLDDISDDAHSPLALLLVKLTAHLDKFRAYWDKCDAFVSEQQMSFGKLHNPEAVRLSYHCLSYFTIRYAQFKKTIEFPAYWKTRVLGAPKGIDKKQRKKWAVDKCCEILVLQNDTTNKIFFDAHRKKDDLADVVIQALAYLWKECVSKKEKSARK